MEINIHEAKTHLSRLLQRVLLGEEIIIAKAGKPLAKLVSLHSLKSRAPGAERHKKFRVAADFDELPKELAPFFK